MNYKDQHERFAALDKGRICLPPSFGDINKLPYKERILRLLAFINVMGRLIVKR